MRPHAITPPASKPGVPPARRNARGGLFAASLLLLLSAVLSLVWSHARLMWNDEFLSFYGDALPSLGEVLQVQLHTPISLDPPTYHLLSHLSMEAIGRNAMALRLPALAGFLLLQVSLFLLVRRLAGVRAALVAMALPMCTASFRFSVEGRPYGLLLGLYAACLLCWYTAADRHDRELGVSRTGLLFGLALTIALAVTSHYFGVLILVPVALGELARTVQRRRFDWAMVGALAAGLASVGLVLPFQKALLPYRQHYYTGAVNLHNVSQGYRELFLRYNDWSIPVQRACAATLTAATLLLVFAAFRRFRDRGNREPAYLWAALFSYAALPFFGYLFGRFVTHTMEVRYVIAALVAFAVAVALVLERQMQKTVLFATLLCTIVLFAIAVNGYQIALERRSSEAMLAGFTVPAPLRAELAAHPQQRLSTQSLGDFFLDSYYTPDPAVRARLSLLYDGASELHWLNHNTNAVTAIYLRQFSGLSVTAYRDFLREPEPLLLDYGSGWEWVRKDLEARHIAASSIGTAIRADLLRVNTAHGAEAVTPSKHIASSKDPLREEARHGR